MLGFIPQHIHSVLCEIATYVSSSRCVPLELANRKESSLLTETTAWYYYKFNSIKIFLLENCNIRTSYVLYVCVWQTPFCIPSLQFLSLSRRMETQFCNDKHALLKGLSLEGANRDKKWIILSKPGKTPVATKTHCLNIWHEALRTIIDITDWLIKSIAHDHIGDYDR